MKILAYTRQNSYSDAAPAIRLSAEVSCLNCVVCLFVSILELQVLPGGEGERDAVWHHTRSRSAAAGRG